LYRRWRYLLILIISEGNTAIVHCQLSIVHWAVGAINRNFKFFASLGGQKGNMRGYSFFSSEKYYKIFGFDLI